MACLLGALALTVPAAPAAAGMAKPELKLIKVINKVRARHGLGKLRPNRSLAHAAADHSTDMADNGFFAHTSSNGTDPYSRVRGYTRKRLYGETLAYTPARGNTRPRRILKLWMSSPSHRATLTTPRLRRIGIGRARGFLHGRRVVFWTADLSSAR